MTYYRTNDGTRWGSGLGRNLTPTEVDLNFWDIVQRLGYLEALPGAPPAITSFSVDGDQFYVHFDNGGTLGPYELPQSLFNVLPEGWQPDTDMSYLDTFNYNGTVYVVLRDHHSASTFDPGANGGAGLDYYFAMLESPANALPTGGAAGQTLTKSTSDDYATTWSWKMPTGGVAGQVPVKQSATQDDAEWEFLDASDVGFTPATGSSLGDFDTVGETLEALAEGTPIDPYGIPFTAATGTGIASTTVGDALNEVGSSGGSGRQTMYVPAKGMSALLTDGADAGVFETSSHKNVVATYDFDATLAEGVQFEVPMPKSWDRGDVSFRVYWSHPATTVNFAVAWSVYCASFAGGDDLDQSLLGGSVTIQVTGGTEDVIYKSIETDPITVLNATTLEAPAGDNELLIFQVWRDTSDIGDTMAVDARLTGVHVYYNTSAGSDD